MSDSARPHGRQPTRLPRPWASPGKNTGGVAICFSSSDARATQHNKAPKQIPEYHEGQKLMRVVVSLLPLFPSISQEVMGPIAMILVFLMLSFKPAFHSALSPSSRGSLVPLHFPPLGWYHISYFSWQS